jgi:hypothetical protein
MSLWARAIFESSVAAWRNFRIQGRRTAQLWNQKLARNFLAGVQLASALILLS